MKRETDPSLGPNERKVAKSQIQQTRSDWISSPEKETKHRQTCEMLKKEYKIIEMMKICDVSQITIQCDPINSYLRVRLHVHFKRLELMSRNHATSDAWSKTSILRHCLRGGGGG